MLRERRRSQGVLGRKWVAYIFLKLHCVAVVVESNHVGLDSLEAHGKDDNERNYHLQVCGRGCGDGYVHKGWDGNGDCD